MKTDFIKIYHQHSAQVNDENQNIKFFFVDKPNFTQEGIAYLEVEIKVKKLTIVISSWRQKIQRKYLG